MSSTTTTTELQTPQNVEKKLISLEKSNIDRQKYKFFIWEFETPLRWSNVLGLSTFHILAVYFALTHSYQSPKIVIYNTALGLIIGFGVTAGAHRYWTHRSYKAKLPLKLILLALFSAAGQNSLYNWVRDHRVHHKFSETDADPHNSKRGFFFAHVGWLMMKKHPEVIKKGRQVDCSDLFEDPLIVFYERHFIWFKLFFAFILPTIIPPLTWGESWTISTKATIVRYVLSLNSTWLVNSAAHLWGNRPYDKMIGPVENVLVSYFAMGEGFHNYHHTFPWDYKASEFSVFLNATTVILHIFKHIGWAYDMKTPSQEIIRKVVENKGDGSHYKWGNEIPESCENTVKES